MICKYVHSVCQLREVIEKHTNKISGNAIGTVQGSLSSLDMVEPTIGSDCDSLQVCCSPPAIPMLSANTSKGKGIVNLYVMKASCMMHTCTRVRRVGGIRCTKVVQHSHGPCGDRVPYP